MKVPLPIEGAMQAGSKRTQGIDALDIRHYLRVVWKRKWLIGAVVAATTGAAWVFQSQQVPIFQATTTILIEPEPPRVVNIADITPGPGNAQEYYATQQRIITSRPVVEAAIKRLDLGTRIPAVGNSSDPVASFVRRTSVDAVRNTRLISVRFEDPDPQVAADVANGLAAEYVRHNVSQKHRTAQEALTWLNEQIGELRGKAKASTAALQAFQARADLLGLQEQRQLTQAKIIDINRTYQEAQNQRLTMESKLKELTEVAKDPNAAESILRVADDPLIRKLQSEASDLLGQRARLSQLYREKHPDLLALDAQIRLVNQRIQEELKNILQSLQTELRVARGREQTLLTQVNELRREAQRLTTQEAQARALDRERESSEELYGAVLKRLNETGLTSALDASNIRIVELATPPSWPVRPRTRLIMILSVVAGLGLGVVAAFVVEQMDDRVRTPDDVERVVGVPVIGIVPVFSTKQDA